MTSIRLARCLVFTLFFTSAALMLHGATDLRFLTHEVLAAFFDGLASDRGLLFRLSTLKWSDTLFYLPFSIASTHFPESFNQLALARIINYSIVSYPLISVLTCLAMLRSYRALNLAVFPLISYGICLHGMLSYPTHGSFLAICIFWPTFLGLLFRHQYSSAKWICSLGVILLAVSHETTVTLMIGMLLLTLYQSRTRLDPYDKKLLVGMILALALFVFRIQANEMQKISQYAGLFSVYTEYFTSYFNYICFAVLFFAIHLITLLIKPGAFENAQRFSFNILFLFSVVFFFMVIFDEVSQLADHGWRMKALIGPFTLVFAIACWQTKYLSDNNQLPDTQNRHIWWFSALVLAIVVAKEWRLNHYHQMGRQILQKLAKQHPGTNVITDSAFHKLYFKTRGNMKYWSLPMSTYDFSDPNRLQISSFWFVSEDDCKLDCSHNSPLKHVDTLRDSGLADIIEINKTSPRIHSEEEFIKLIETATGAAQKE